MEDPDDMIDSMFGEEEEEKEICFLSIGVSPDLEVSGGRQMVREITEVFDGLLYFDPEMKILLFNGKDK